MNFLAPIYFWTLLGLTIPLLIHLWNRKKIKTIKIGSVQLLKESNSKQTRSFRINEWILLFLRLLMMAILTFLLVEPVINRTVSRSDVIVIIEPQMAADKRFLPIIDSLTFSEIRLLQPGFPIYEKGMEIDFSNRPNYWQLAQEMEKLNADSLVVLSYGLIAGIKGIRPSVSHQINWINIPTPETEKNYLSAQIKGDSIQLLSMYSDDRRLYFKKEIVSSSNNEIDIDEKGDSILILSGEQKKRILYPESSLEVAIYFEEETNETMQLCVASLNAMGEYLDQKIKIQSAKTIEALPKINYDLVISLTQEPISLDAKRMLVYRPDSTAQNLIIPGKERTTFLLTKQLSTIDVLKTHFPEKLWEIMARDEVLEREIELSDVRQMNLALLKPGINKKEVASGSFESRSASTWLWIIFLLTFTAERILSKVRKQ